MKFNWKLARLYLYPCQYDIIAANYPYASGGDATKKAAIDAHIALVNAAIPEDSTEYTEEDLLTKLNTLKSDAAFIKMNDNNYWYKNIY